jgi:hypothetical protein
LSPGDPRLELLFCPLPCDILVVFGARILLFSGVLNEKRL